VPETKRGARPWHGREGPRPGPRRYVGRDHLAAEARGRTREPPFREDVVAEVGHFACPVEEPMIGVGARLCEADDFTRVVDRGGGGLRAAQRPEVGHRSVAPHPGALHAFFVVATADDFIRVVDPGRRGEDASRPWDQAEVGDLAVCKQDRLGVAFARNALGAGDDAGIVDRERPRLPSRGSQIGQLAVVKDEGVAFAVLEVREAGHFSEVVDRGCFGEEAAT
jgi:hypothetical protein